MHVVAKDLMRKQWTDVPLNLALIDTSQKNVTTTVTSLHFENPTLSNRKACC